MNRRRIAVISAIALVVLSVVGWKGYGWWLKHRLERYQTELAAQGERLTVDKLLAGRTEPERNGARWFQQAQRHLPRGGILTTNRPSTMRLVGPARALIVWQQPSLVDYSGATNTWEELEVELRESQEAIDLLHQLVESPDLDFGLDYSQGFNLLLPHLGPLKSFAQTLSAAAMLDLHQGRTDAAALDLRAMLALCKGGSNEPVLVSQLVRIAITDFAMTATWQFLQSPGINEDQLRQLQDDWSALHFVEPMWHALEMERAVIASAIRHYRQYGGVYELFGRAGAGPLAPTQTWEKGVERTRQLFSPRAIRKRSNELLWQSALSYDDELLAMKGIQVLIETCREIQTNQCFADSLSNAVSRLEAMGLSEAENSDDSWMVKEDLSLADIRGVLGSSSPALLKSLRRVQTAEVMRSLLVTAIALKRYQLRHGELPVDLAALVPEQLPAVPLDPVDSSPLRYQRRPDGSFLLYSIGEDGLNNGGDASPASGKPFLWQNGRDWVWPQPASPEEIERWAPGQR